MRTERNPSYCLTADFKNKTKFEEIDGEIMELYLNFVSIQETL